MISFYSTEESYYYSTGSTLVHAPSGGQVDFQVQAVQGYLTAVENPIKFMGTPEYYHVFTEIESSNWSRTQTLTVNVLIPNDRIYVILVVAAMIVGVIAGLLIYFKKRKCEAESS